MNNERRSVADYTSPSEPGSSGESSIKTPDAEIAAARMENTGPAARPEANISVCAATTGTSKMEIQISGGKTSQDGTAEFTSGTAGDSNGGRERSRGLSCDKAPPEVTLDRAKEIVSSIELERVPKFKEETRADGTKWRIISVNSTLHNLGAFDKPTIAEFQEALNQSITNWNKELEKYHIEFRLDSNGIQVNLGGKEIAERGPRVRAHKHLQQGLICISPNSVTMARDYGCSQLTFFRPIESLKECLQELTTTEDQLRARRIEMYVETLSHELGHEALDHYDRGPGLMATRHGPLRLSVPTKDEAWAFAYVVWNGPQQKLKP